jgi:hypothetical protein
MRVRRTVRLRKVMGDHSGGWSKKDLPPRWCPVFLRKRPIAGDWQWRAARAASGAREFTVVAQCNPSRGNWKALLIERADSGASVVARFEYHSGHPGLHIHSHCERSGLETGPTSLDALARIPPANARHRRTHAFTLQSFWEAALRFFNIVESAATTAGENYGLF